MVNYVDPTKITYKSNIKEMENFWFFHYSEDKSSYVSDSGVHDRCSIPCDIDHPYYWSNMPFHNHFNDLDLRNDKNAIGCFGCSFTHGFGLESQDTWPFLLQQKTNVNCLNFGTVGAGIDSIYLNLKASALDYKFKKVIILLPGFDRRLARLKHKGSWLKWPVLVNRPTTFTLLPSPIHKSLQLDMDQLRSHGENVVRKIVKDENNKYDKKILDKLLKFCRRTYDQFNITSWSNQVYDFLLTNCKENTIPFYDMNGPKAHDNVHPTRTQNTRFVNSID
tara:strand:- start:55 stop:888 length:834 start_codon:yes stop_codon:yes gene_type:complete